MIERVLFGLAGSMLLSTNLFGLGAGTIEDNGSERHAVVVPHLGAGYLGVSIRDINGEDAQKLGLPAERGAYIEGVEEGSPAEDADLREDDVVLEYAGNSVFGVRQFQRLVAETPPGRDVQMKVWREGSGVELSAKIGGRGGRFPFFGVEPGIRFEKKIVPGSDSDPHMFLFDGHDFIMNGRKPRLGVQVAPLTDQMADFLGIPGREGVLILETLPSTPAETAGLQAGDVILSVNGTGVSTPIELTKHLTDGENELEFARKKEIRSVKVKLEEVETRPKDVLEM